MKSNSQRVIRRIVVHCSAGSQSTKASEIVAYHLRPAALGGRGWKTPGYHYIVEADGNVVNTVEEHRIANGAKGFNSDSLHVCYVGGIDSKGRATDNRTDEQKQSLRRLLGELRRRYPDAEIVGHRDLSPDKNGNGKVDVWERVKACPSFDAAEEYR